jgi:trigger factor
MQVSVEAGDGLVRRMRVELSAAELEQEVEKRLQSFRRSARLPGFRPGKVPLKLLRQRFGDGVRSEVLSDQIKSSFPRAIEQENLRPAGRPEIEPVVGGDDAAPTYAYQAQFEVLPEIEPASLTGRKLTRPVAEVTDADVDEMIERLRRQAQRWEETDRAAAHGDRLTVSFQGTVDGEPVPKASADDLKVELGAGRLFPGFDSQLVGAASGDEREVIVDLPEDSSDEKLAGKQITFAVQVKGVEAPMLPEVDADFVANFGVDDGDIDRFRSDVRGNMTRELEQRIKAKVKNQVMDILVEANPIDLPRSLVKEEINALRDQTSERGGKFQLPDELFEEAARRRVALGLIVAELVKRHGLNPDRERIRAAVEEIAATYEDPESVIRYYFGDESRLESVRSLVMEDMVVEQVLSEVDVEDESTTFSALTGADEAQAPSAAS